MDYLPELTLITPRQLRAGARLYTCQIGRGGLIAGAEKREGDGCTPRGSFALRACYFRPDRIAPPPRTALPLIPLSRNDGWCDDPDDAAYNTPVTLPYPARCEALWRDDHAYDLIIPLGYNDAPVRPGLGSAIFMHITHDDARPTAGCIALAKNDFLELLHAVSKATRLVI